MVWHNVFRRNEFGRNAVLDAAEHLNASSLTGPKSCFTILSRQEPGNRTSLLTMACRIESVLLGDFMFLAIMRIEHISLLPLGGEYSAGWMNCCHLVGLVLFRKWNDL